jgi:DNA-binding IclR family transcriptional regulator
VGEEEKGSQTVAAIERAADILLYFTQVSSPDLGITDIAVGLGLSKAAVHRVLASLRSRDLIYLDEDTRRYSLGTAALLLGLNALERIDVRKLALPELSTLTELTNETATLSVRSGSSRVYLDQITPAREVIMSVSIGVPYPLHAGGSSKAFLAFLDPVEIDQYLSGPLSSVTSMTRTNRRDLLAELDEIRSRGWAESIGERQSGAASVAAPVFDHHGQPVAVLSVCGPADRFTAHRDTCAKHLIDATMRLSTKLGYQPGDRSA